MISHEQRKQRADDMATPAFYFSYVLEFEDGTFYAGSTNAPLARWTEHAVGKGAKATQGKPFTVRMATPFLSRREAEYNEWRLQKALASGGPQVLAALLGVFDQMLNIVRPQKTFSQLRDEEAAYESEMQRVFHHSHASMFNPGGRPGTACGYNGYQFFSTPDWSTLKKKARDEDFTGNIYGRRVCRRCLDSVCQRCLDEAPAPEGDDGS
jgi:predicted GIY-YIG superfamily endonuclease